MTLTIIGWICWGCAVASIFICSHKAKPLYLVATALFLLVSFVLLAGS